MFEREAEEYCMHQSLLEDVRNNICKAFEDGAEFGYNQGKAKANEWHYPSKGEYPKEYENVLCCCKVVNAEFYSIGHTIIGGDTKIRW